VRDATLVTADRRFAHRLVGTQWQDRCLTLWN
jgi:hypothetical protein